MPYNEGYLQTHPALNPVFFRSWSPKTIKSRVVCLHGTGGTSADFSRLGNSMQSGTSELMAIDLPGTGNSLAQPNVSPRHQLGAQIKFLQRLLTQDNLPSALICSSGRAVLGFWYLYQARDQETAASMPVVFLEPAFSFNASTKQFIESCLTFFARQYETLDAAIKAWDSCDLGKTRFDNEADKRDYIKNHLRPDGRLLRPHLSAERQAQVLNTRAFDLLENKDQVKNPTLVLYGSESNLSEKHALETNRVFLNLTSRVIQGSSHPLTLYRQSEIEEVKNFLQANKIE